MHRSADALYRCLTDFVAQPDYPTLLLSGSDPSMVFPSRILSALDRQDDARIYLLFPAPCHDGHDYVDAVAQGLSLQLEALNVSLQAEREAPWPALPLEVIDRRTAPVHRLRAAVDYVSARLTRSDVVVWGLLPSELNDVAGYAELIEPFLAASVIEPWMDRHRFVVRDHPPRLSLLPILHQARNDRILVYEVDFGTDRALQSLTSAALDVRLSAEERVHAFHQLAAFDLANREYARAFEKYGACFNFYQERGDVAQQALCLSEAADVLMQAEQPEAALVKYQQSLAVSLPTQNLALILAGLLGAGVACLALNDCAQAEGYLSFASDTAGKLLNPYAKCDIMEKLGTARWRLRKVEEAISTWVKAKQLAKQVGHVARARSILDHLIVVCRQGHLERHARDFETEREDLAVGAVSP